MDSQAPSLIPADASQADTGRMSAGCALAALRRFARPRPPRERCDLCAAEIGHAHHHLFSPADRQLACACDACAILFSGGNSAHYRLVPRRGEYWAAFHIDDAEWQAMNIPINLAFFTVPSLGEQVQAFYPSPAGATESHVTAEAWEALKARQSAAGRAQAGCRSAARQSHRIETRIFPRADRRMLQAGRPDPRQLARPVRRRGCVEGDRGVFPRAARKIGDAK